MLCFQCSTHLDRSCTRISENFTLFVLYRRVFLSLWMLVFVFIAMYFCPDESLSLHISNCVVICFQKSVFLWL